MATLKINDEFRSASAVYKIRSLLGKGKSGYSYLIENADGQRVLKLMHSEEVPYYKFDDKIGAEIACYKQFLPTSLKIPVLREYDLERQYLIKDFIDGTVASAAIAQSQITPEIFRQLFHYAKELESQNINLDYFPSNFIIKNDELYYIDYESNPYSDPWNFLNWGIYYWINNEGMKKFLTTNDAAYINASPAQGIPIKEGLRNRVEQLKAVYWS